MRVRTSLACALGVLTLGVLYVVWNAREPDPPSRYPELESVPEADLARAREALPERDSMGFVGTPAVRARLEETLRERATVTTPGDLLGALDDCAPLAVVAVLHERAGRPGASISHAPCFLDGTRRPVGAWLARRRDASLNRVLLRLAADEDLEFAVRDETVAALCWEGNAEAVAGLTALALDKDVEPILRDRVLARLPRVGAPPADGFEDLLYLPFHGHDEYAAAVLALTGRPVAPSLVVAGFAHDTGHAGDREHLLVRAAAVLSAGDPEVSAAAERALDAIEGSWFRGRHPETEEAEVIARVAEAFAQWRTAHPAVHPSRFELERLAYRRGPRFQRERRVFDAVDPASIPESEIDFAAAALRITDEEGRWRDRSLDALDRLALLLRDDLADAKTPWGMLQAMHRRLFPKRARYSSGVETGPSSFLGKVLYERAGNCVGLTSLYVALGERLDLPFVAVTVPQHVFLRWDDGDVVLDVELTDGGGLRTPEDLEGATPRVLTRKGLLSVVLSNRSSAWLDSPRLRDEGRVARALEFADAALAYDESNEAAHLARARALARRGMVEEALASAQRAFDLQPSDVGAPIVAGESWLRAGRFDEALAWFDRALAIDAKSEDATVGRLACLGALNRDREVIEEADAILAEGDHPRVRTLRLRAMVKLDREGWERELDNLAAQPPASWNLRTSVARILLDRDAPGAALDVLAPLGDLEAAERKARGTDDKHVLVDGPGGSNLVVPASNLRTWTREAWSLEAEAYERLGRDAEAAELRRRANSLR